MIKFEKTKIKNTVNAKICIHYPAEIDKEICDKNDNFHRLDLLKRLKSSIENEIKKVQQNIEREAINNSGQLKIHDEISKKEKG